MYSGIANYSQKQKPDIGKVNLRTVESLHLVFIRSSQAAPWNHAEDAIALLWAKH
jgi:hypothetical protein